MVRNLKKSVRWVRLHSTEYGIDPDCLGLIGGSAGGHLALMAAVTEEPGNPDAENPLERQSTQVKAVGAFFPPTDIVDWNGEPDGYLKLTDLLSRGGTESLSPEETRKRAEAISPCRHVKAPTPPMLLIHGDADPLVPLEQSRKMLEAVRQSGGEIELIVKEGGEHSWPTLHEEVAVMADWFDRKLRKN